LSTSEVGGVDWASLTGYTESADQTEEKDLLDKEVFMEMLITQLENQDPLSPMENQEFTAQLAQLTQVEQLRTANTNLETLQLYQSSINNAQSVSLIGKQVKALGDQFGFDGESVKLSFHAEGSGTAHITIYGPDGDVVRTLDKSGIEAGVNSFSWDGFDANNSPCDDGDYSFTVKIEDDSGGSVNAYTLIAGEVKGVVFENGIPYLDVEGQKVTIGDIYEVNTK
jgi:flagellar basal-body rod modification protein FlgD